MRYKSLLRSDPVIVLIILLALGASCLYADGGEIQEVKPAAPALQLTPTVAQAQGRLVFVEKFFDFGTVTEGDIIRHTFKFKNEGAGTLKIVKTESSCGCTTLSGVIKDYAPGEGGEMEVVVDTRGKKGVVVKTVTLALANNNAASTELALSMKLEPPPHPRMEKMGNINTEAACKTCHLESGVGESGVFLYHRVCSQCHGKKGAGGFGLALNDAKWQKVDDAYIKKIIRSGLPDIGMPSFVDGVTPPLTEDQVGSLLKYIRSMVKH